MGTIYKCAVLEAKLKIINNLLTKIPSNGSDNIRINLNTQVEMIRKSIESAYCRDISDQPSELSMKGVLLDNTMYQYCTYQYYLNYLDYNAKNALNTYFQDSKNSSGSTLLYSTDIAASYIARQSNRIGDELEHIKIIYPQALVAYTEFERTYASHIVLMFILQDYVTLRTSLKKLLNPIGQVIYKASNAQSPTK